MESGLHQNGMRDYDPTTGRYLEPDPLGLVDGASVYGYARQSPLRWTDPRGEATKWQILPPAPMGLGTDWSPDADYGDPSPGNAAFKHRCSNARLEFHKGKIGANGWEARDHWHFFPNGGGSRKQRYGFPGGDHLLPDYAILVEDCDCNNGGGGGVPLMLMLPGAGLAGERGTMSLRQQPIF